MADIGSPEDYFRAGPNAAGQVAGSQNRDVGEQYAYAAVVRDPDGSVRQLDYLHATDLYAEVLGISDGGLAIGYSSGDESCSPVIWDLATGSALQIGICGFHEGVGCAAISASGYAAWTTMQAMIYPDPENHGGRTSEVILRGYRRSPCGVVEEFSPPLTGDWFVVDVTNDGTALASRNYPSISYLWNTDGTR